jgi:hypothetical protein
VLYYTLEKATDIDYLMPSQDQLELDARLKREKSLSAGRDVVTLDKERVFIPAKQRRRLAVHLHYPVTETDSSRIAEGAGQTNIEGGTGGTGPTLVTTTVAFHATNQKGDFECLALALSSSSGSAGRGIFSVNAIYSSGSQRLGRFGAWIAPLYRHTDNGYHILGKD